MESDRHETAKKGFLFSGEMTASATHEINNNLAVIKENAGLMEDLALLSDAKAPLSPEKIITIGKRIQKHVGKASETVANMNRLAHSTDRFETTVDILETVAFLKTITSRLMGNRGVTLAVTSTLGSPVMTTSPFFLKQLIWQCITFLMGENQGVKEIQINIAGGDKSVILFFKGVSVSKEAFDRFASNEVNAINSPINSDITRDENSGMIALILQNSSC